MLLFQFPVGHPECGWDGEFCQSDIGISEFAKASIASFLTVFCVVIFSTLVVCQRFRYKHYSMQLGGVCNDISHVPNIHVCELLNQLIDDTSCRLPHFTS